MTESLAKRCDVIEECYEFMLAYAAQGLAGDGGARAGAIRDFLNRAAEAIRGLAEDYQAIAARQSAEHAPKFQAFQAVLERDARDTLAAVELVLTQAVISSQLIDNLNASIHLRALLTDLFVVDEVLKSCAQ